MNVVAPQDQSLNRSHGAVGHIGDDATHEGDVVFVKGLPDFTGTGPLPSGDSTAGRRAPSCRSGVTAPRSRSTPSRVPLAAC